MSAPFASVDEYIASFPPEMAEVLSQVRGVLHASVPGAGEKISYGMPMLTLDDRNLVSFAAWKHHLGVYPIPAGDPAFARDIERFRDAKSTARFAWDEPVPLELIGRLAAFVAAERGMG